MSSTNSKYYSPKNYGGFSDAKKLLRKKKWRKQKYDNKMKVLKWESIKQKQALRQYNKELKKLNIDIPKEKPKILNEKNSFQSSLKKAQLQYQRIQEEKDQRRKQNELLKQKREEALKAYKEKKAIRQQKLFCRNKFGKPSMKGRLELLLEKIEKEYGKDNNTS